MALGPVRLTSTAVARETFIHELTHTQDKSDSRGHIFFVNGKNYSYGPDDVHFNVEAMPNAALTYTEGIADSMTLCYSNRATMQYWNWFSDNGALWVEKPPTSPPAGITWLHDVIRTLQPPVPQLPALTPRADATDAQRQEIRGINQRYVFYRVRSLPPQIIMRNEFILALILSQYAYYTDFDVCMQALTANNIRSTNVCSSAIATLFDELSSRTGTGNQRFLPLAFADYFTGFRAQNEAEFGQVFEGALSQQRWITPYFALRPQVRAAVHSTAGQGGATQFRDLTDIAVALGITQTQPGGPR